MDIGEDGNGSDHFPTVRRVTDRDDPPRLCIKDGRPGPSSSAANRDTGLSAIQGSGWPANGLASRDGMRRTDVKTRERGGKVVVTDALITITSTRVRVEIER